MSYVLTDGPNIKVYPYNIGLLRRDNPNVSFPASPTDAQLAEWNVFPVSPTSVPDYDPLSSRVTEDRPRLSGSAWVQVWRVESLSTEEAKLAFDGALASLRADRDERLRMSDWTQMSDSPLTADQRAAWVKYRQALRDLPGATANPLAPVWPVEPAR